MKLWLKVIIIAALAAGTLHLGAPPPADAASSTWTTKTVQAYGGVWIVQQTASFTTTYSASGAPTYLRLNWAYCHVDAMFITIGVDWCGGYRASPTRIDMGFNFTKTAFWLLGQQGCWARVWATAARWGATWGATRTGC